MNLEGSSDALQTSTTTLAKGQHGWLLLSHRGLFSTSLLKCLEVPGKPGAPDVTSLDVDYVELSWLPPIYDGGLPITGYLVELKTKRANEWLKVNLLLQVLIKSAENREKCSQLCEEVEKLSGTHLKN